MASNKQEPESNDKVFHILICTGLVILGLFAGGYVQLNSDNQETKEKMHQLEREYNGYRNGVRDVR